MKTISNGTASNNFKSASHGTFGNSTASGLLKPSTKYLRIPASMGWVEAKIT
ncbi:hypothetical protein D3C78_1653300 [compost metagenome]